MSYIFDFCSFFVTRIILIRLINCALNYSWPLGPSGVKLQSFVASAISLKISTLNFGSRAKSALLKPALSLGYIKFYTNEKLSYYNKTRHVDKF